MDEGQKPIHREGAAAQQFTCAARMIVEFDSIISLMECLQTSHWFRSDSMDLGNRDGCHFSHSACHICISMFVLVIWIVQGNNMLLGMRAVIRFDSEV